MAVRAWIGLALIALLTSTAVSAAAQDEEHRLLARELARLMLDDTMRRGFDEQVGDSMVRVMAATVQQHLNRGLLEVEWQLLTGIVRRFVRDTLPPGRIEEIAAGIYVRHFDVAELRELLAFQRSPVGRKAARLTAVIAGDTVRAVDREIRTSAAMPGMLAELQRTFPALGTSQSP